MNKIDKKWYEALRYLSRYNSRAINYIKKTNPQEYHNHVPKYVEDFFHIIGYIQFDEKYPQIVTQGGLQQLRDLEDIRRKDSTLIASVIAVCISLFSVCISLVALAKGFGLI